MTAAKTLANAVAFSMLCALLGGTALAAPASVDRSATKVADASQIRQVSETEDDETAGCSKSRKRLWVEGEGWVVRKVTTCR